jgi:hypothetical protein
LGLVKKSEEPSAAGIWTFEDLAISNTIFASKLHFNDVNGDGVEPEGIYKIPELGINCFITTPAFILSLDYP